MMTYGATNSGKSFTVFGSSDQSCEPSANSYGLLLRSIRDLLGTEFRLWMSFYELYNNASIDLLRTSPTPQSNQTKIFPVRNCALRKFTSVTEVEIRDRKHAEEMLNLGLKNRHTASTTFNYCSSRSHAFVSIRLQRKNSTEDCKKQSILLSKRARKKLDAGVDLSPVVAKRRQHDLNSYSI